MERSADVLAAGLLEVADPSLSSKFFLRQVCLNLLQLYMFSVSFLFLRHFSSVMEALKYI